YHVEIPAREIQPREREIARADHERQQEIAERRRDRRYEEKPYHDHAVERERLVVRVRAHEIAVRRDELEPDQRRGNAAEEEESRDRNREQDGDALVVARREPRAQTIARVEIAALPCAGVHGGSGRRCSDSM